MSTQTFKASLSTLHQILEFIHQAATLKDFDKTSLHAIILACEEALINIIHYSYLHASGEIKVTCKDSKKKPGITIFIEDGGKAFNPLKKTNAHSILPPGLSDDQKQGGYGIYLFTHMMDDVKYRPLKNGNLLALTKYL